MDYDHTIPGITLITGVITTTAWGIAAYTGGTEVREINFNAPVGMLASAGAKILFQNKNLPNMTLREGPSTLPERLKGTLEADSRDTAAIGDQNVFLQFVRIRYRFMGLWRVIRAEGSKKSDDGRQYSPEPELEPDEQPVRNSIWEHQFNLGLSSIAQGYDQLDEIIAYIFEVESYVYLRFRSLISWLEH